MKQEDFQGVQLPTTYQGDESHLIAAEVGADLGEYGTHRLLTMNISDHNLFFYEATSGDKRYPPGRMLFVQMTDEEFERAVTVYQHFKARREKEEAERKAQITQSTKDDFDPFLDSDDLP